MNIKKYDCIVVGQGLAGSVLALQLLWSGKKVMVISEPSLSSSSMVAAGLWNPVVFKRLTKSWMIDELLPEMIRFYSTVEKELGLQLIQERKITKLFSEEQEEALWLKKSGSDLHHYLENKIYQQHSLTGNKYSFVLNCGNLHIPLFLGSTKNYLQQQEAYTGEIFDYSVLQLNAGGVGYKNVRAAAVIFCEGHCCAHNPYFRWVPLKPAKGEVITISCKDLDLEHVLNKGIFILPLGNDTYKVGATYEWEDLSESPTEKGKNYLLEKLNRLISKPYSILKHEAGIRPSVIDRRPVMGNHPQHSALKLFNGMGTKGVMLAPYFARHFSDFMEGKCPLLKEVDLERFKHLQDIQ